MEATYSHGDKGGRCFTLAVLKVSAFDGLGAQLRVVCGRSAFRSAALSAAHSRDYSDALTKGLFVYEATDGPLTFERDDDMRADEMLCVCQEGSVLITGVAEPGDLRAAS